jgi:hypothetical protein
MVLEAFPWAATDPALAIQAALPLAVKRAFNQDRAI